MTLHNLPKAVQTVLANRGVHDIGELDTDIGGLLSGQTLLGIDKAVMRLDNAIDRGERILVVGDFDCDGATSTALCMDALTKMGANVHFLVPDRVQFGYGLTPQIIAHGIKLYNPHLILTVDNGISSFEGVDFAHAQGIEVVITDHHHTQSEAPNAYAVVNPNQIGCTFASKSLVGVGVAFYVMGALAKYRRMQQKSSTNVAHYLDLVALGTVADLGVLDKNNRILVYWGLQAIQNGVSRAGIYALCDICKIDASKISVHNLGFHLAPRINAAGRMDNMQVGIECLLANEINAPILANELARFNGKRREIQAQMRSEAQILIENTPDFADSTTRAIILHHDDWHQGVIGIIAGQLKEHYHLPAWVFAPAGDGSIKGSARSIAGIHMRDLIQEIADNNQGLICHFGGHAMAAGLSLKAQNLALFSEKIHERLSHYPQAIFVPQQRHDGALLPDEYSLEIAKLFKRISIWGHGFEEPIFCDEFLVLNYQILKDTHLKLLLKKQGVQYPIEAICFFAKLDEWDYRAHMISARFALDINHYMGQQKLQLTIKDWCIMQIK